MKYFSRRASAPNLKVSSDGISSLRYMGSANLLRLKFSQELEKSKKSKAQSLSTESLSDPIEPKPLKSSKRTILPHQYTEDPSVVWEMLKDRRPVKSVRQMKLDTPINDNCVRFVCTACLHGERLNPEEIPEGDILIIAGNLTNSGLSEEIRKFNENMSELNHPFKVIIAGNHDVTFDEKFLKTSSKNMGENEHVLKQKLISALSGARVNDGKSLLKNVLYLQDSMITIHGLNIYGTPWVPRCDSCLAFNLSRGQQILDKWNQIPGGIDVLITHTPPLGHGDMLPNGARFGCVELLNSVVKRVRPKYHIFGHTHQGYGCTSDGYTKFVNCCHKSDATANNLPVIFDIPIKEKKRLEYLKSSRKIMRREWNLRE